MAQISLLNPADITALINAMKVVFPTRDEVEKIVEEKLDAKIKNIPTKDEFFTRMDKLSGEIQAKRQTQDLHQGQHDQITDRLDKLEKRVGISSI